MFRVPHNGLGLDADALSNGTLNRRREDAARNSRPDTTLAYYLVPHVVRGELEVGSGNVADAFEQGVVDGLLRSCCAHGQ